MNIAESDSILLPPVAELIVGVIAFGLLCFVLMRFVFPRMEQMYQARVEAIEGGLRKAEQAQEQANALLEQYRRQLAQARAESAAIRDEARVESAAIREEILAKAAQERDRIVAVGREQLTQQRESIVRELRGEVGILAVDLAERIVGESLRDEVRQRGTVDRFLAELDDSAAAATAAGNGAGGRR